MSLRRIEKVSLAYALLYYPVGFFHRLFYKKLEIAGKDSLPEDAPIIFLPNHQNALMDALAILYGYGRPVVFLARADIFKNPKIAKILYFLKIMPIFRPRDGMDNMEKNDATFHRSVEVLRYRRPMAMFPEGMFNPCKNLAPLKKGFARIACMSEDASDWNLNLHIVPVGIDYSDKRNRYSDILINFGKAIPIAPLKSAYEEHPNKAYRILTEQVYSELSSLMINIRHTEYHTTYMRLFEMFEEEGLCDKATRGKRRRFVWEQNLAERLDALADREPAVMERLDGIVSRYFDATENAGVSDRLVREYRPGSITLVMRNAWSLLLSVFYLPQLLIHAAPLFTAKPVLKKIKDPQFISSVRYATWFVSSVLYYALLLALFCCFTGILWLKFAFLPLLFLHGMFIRSMTPRVKMSVKLFNMLRMNGKDHAELRSLRISISDILAKYLSV